MNAFRATILVLLALTVGLLFYAFAVLLPQRQAQYESYQTQLKINEYQQRQQEHEERMARLGANAETPEMAAARAAAEEADKKSEADLTAAEESSVIASAKRRLEREETSAPEAQPVNASVLGEVTAYLEDCAVILFKSGGNEPLNEGLNIAVRRQDYIVCEAVVDGRDEESGQFTAAIKQVVFSGALDPATEENRKPAPGDEVIISPFLSSRDLRLEGYNPQEDAQPAADAPQKLPEIEAVLTPVPAP